MPSVIETEIFSRMVDPGNPSLTPEVANALLVLGFAESDHERMTELAQKSNEGLLTNEERREFEGYIFVGNVLSILKSKARVLIRKKSPVA